MATSDASLLERVCRTCQQRQFTIHTERSYRRWVVCFVHYHDTTHPRHLDASDVRACLSHLATSRTVTASTQNQALNALVFFYGEVLDEPLEEGEPMDHAPPEWAAHRFQ